MQCNRLAVPGCAVIKNSRNLGFIQPNINALGIARGEYLVLLNNDTIVPPGWLDALEAPFLADPFCAISGPTGCELDDKRHQDALRIGAYLSADLKISKCGERNGTEKKGR